MSEIIFASQLNKFCIPLCKQGILGMSKNKIHIKKFAIQEKLFIKSRIHIVDTCTLKIKNEILSKPSVFNRKNSYEIFFL